MKNHIPLPITIWIGRRERVFEARWRTVSIAVLPLPMTNTGSVPSRNSDDVSAGSETPTERTRCDDSGIGGSDSMSVPGHSRHFRGVLVTSGLPHAPDMALHRNN